MRSRFNLKSVFRLLFRKEQVEQELDEEVRFHVERQIEEYVRAGMGLREARRRAMLELGGVEQVKERVREVRWTTMIETIWQDIRFSIRMLGKNPGFTITAVLVLGIGIGANTAIFSLVNLLFLDPLPKVADSGGIYEITRLSKDNRDRPISYPDFQYIRENGESFDGMFAQSFQPVNLAQEEKAERVWFELVSEDFFSVLRVKPVVGRFFLAEEHEAPDRNPVIVLTYGFWQKSFGGDPAVVGRTVSVNGKPYEIVGVTEEGFLGAMTAVSADAWVPVMMQNQIMPGGDRLQRRGTGWLLVKGRLRRGVTAAQAQAELKNLARNLAVEYPEINEGRSARLIPLWNTPFGAQRVIGPMLILLTGLVSLVLLLACSNVANLMLARGASRQREIAIRLALGAGRIRLIRQLLTESLLLAGLGGVAGIGLAYALLQVGGAPPQSTNIPLVFTEPELNGQVLLFTLGISMVSGIIFGLLPAFQTSNLGLGNALNMESGRSTGGRRKTRLRSALVVVQLSLALVLLVTAGLFLQSLLKVQEFDPGFNAKNVLLSTVDLYPNGYSRERGHEFFREVKSRAEALPDVVSAAWARFVPLGIILKSRSGFRVEGYDPAPNENVSALTNHISPDYFRTMEIPLLAGRDFAWSDTDDSDPVVIINEMMAQRYWAGRSPLGGKVHTSAASRTIIGVVSTIKYSQLNEAPAAMMYFSVTQSSRQNMTLHVRRINDPAALTAGIRSIVEDLDPKLPLFGVTTLVSFTSTASMQQALASTMLGVFGVLALLMAAVGLYGVLAFSVGQRTHEIGVRMALGAQRQDILRMILWHGFRLILLGAGLGLLGAWALTRLMSSLLFGVEPGDPLTFALTAALLASVSLLACYLPARRASRVDPMVALRYE